MGKMTPAADADAYVDALAGWQRTLVARLRAAVRGGARLEEGIKWGNLVYFSNGPAIVIHCEEGRVVLSFWRGRRLRGIEPRLKAGGKYEMAGLQLREGDAIAPAVVRRLAKEAVALNAALGDPTKVAAAR